MTFPLAVCRKMDRQNSARAHPCLHIIFLFPSPRWLSTVMSLSCRLHALTGAATPYISTFTRHQEHQLLWIASTISSSRDV